MKRREFIRRAASGMGAAAWLGSGGLAEQSGFLASLGMTNGAELVAARLAALPALPRKFAANETVTIGRQEFRRACWRWGRAPWVRASLASNGAGD